MVRASNGVAGDGRALRSLTAAVRARAAQTLQKPLRAAALGGTGGTRWREAPAGAAEGIIAYATPFPGIRPIRPLILVPRPPV